MKYCKREFAGQYLQTPSFEAACFISTDAKRDQAKAWSDPWESGERAGGDWTTSRLLSPSISLHVAVSFVCQSKGRWMGVNWNQFPLSDTINGVAQEGGWGLGRGGSSILWLLILPCKHAWNLPPGICLSDNNKPTSFLCAHTDTSWVPSSLPQGEGDWRGRGQQLSTV